MSKIKFFKIKTDYINALYHWYNYHFLIENRKNGAFYNDNYLPKEPEFPLFGNFNKKKRDSIKDYTYDILFEKYNKQILEKLYENKNLLDELYHTKIEYYNQLPKSKSTSTSKSKSKKNKPVSTSTSKKNKPVSTSTSKKNKPVSTSTSTIKPKNRSYTKNDFIDEVGLF